MKKYNQTQIQEALEKLGSPEIDSSLVDELEQRVWMSLSKSVFEKQQHLSMSNQQQTQQSPQPQKSWKDFLSNPRYLGLAILVSTVILVVLVASAYNIFIHRVKIQDPQNSTEVALSIEELRKRAEEKFTQLSNGVPLSTLQEAIVTLDQPQVGNSPTTPSAQSVSRDNSTTIVDANKAKEILEREQIKDNVVFYTETETRYFGDNVVFHPSFDKSKPLITKSWMSANYSKTIDYIDGKISSFYLSTPDYSINYMGGKYAVKEIYTNPNYFSGLGFGVGDEDEWSPRNAELEFLKFLLDPNSNLIDHGMQVVDGKNLRVIEDKYTYQDDLDSQETTQGEPSDTDVTVSKDFSTMPITDTYSTKYYIDQKEMVVYLTESYLNGGLEYSFKNLVSKTYKDQPIQDFFNFNEIGNIEIREVEIYYPTAEDLSVAKFITKYDFYYSPEIGLEYAWANDNTLWQKNNYDYHDDPDFNPWIEFYKSQFTDEYASWQYSVASYSQESLFVEIYDEQPNYQNWLYGDSEVVAQKPVKINLAGTPVTGKYTEIKYPEYSYTDENGQILTASPSTILVEFKIGSYWYVINAYKNGMSPNSSAISILSKDVINLSKLTAEQAAEIDQKNAQQYIEPAPAPRDDEVGIIETPIPPSQNLQSFADNSEGFYDFSFQYPSSFKAEIMNKGTDAYFLMLTSTKDSNVSVNFEISPTDPMLMYDTIAEKIESDISVVNKNGIQARKIVAKTKFSDAGGVKEALETVIFFKKGDVYYSIHTQNGKTCSLSGDYCDIFKEDVNTLQAVFETLKVS